MNDHISSSDNIAFGGPETNYQKPALKTKVIFGHDAYQDKNGITQFGEVLFEETNMLVLGGSAYVLEQLFGVESPLTIQHLEDIMPGFKRAGETPMIKPYPADHKVCLFGIGTGGAGESMTDVKEVKYYEREIQDMIPFRQTANELSMNDIDKYWFYKDVDVSGVTKRAFYLKKFETEPSIKILWRDGEGDEDGSEVGSDVHETPDSNTIPIETFIEIILKISKKDVKEYFEDLGNVEQTRINTIALFNGSKVQVGTNAETSEPEYDYRGLTMFSKLNFNNEMLTMAKDLTIAYRIYTS